MGGFIAASDKEIGRVRTSVHFTEEYGNKLIQTLNKAPYEQNTQKVPPAVRLLLVEDCHSGGEALAYMIGRDGTTSGTVVSLVGDNSDTQLIQHPDNKFRLKLEGVVSGVSTDLGTTDAIRFTASTEEVLAAFEPLHPRISPATLSVFFGCIYESPDMVNSTKYNLGLWYIYLNPELFPEYQELRLTPVVGDGDIVGLVQVQCQTTFDLLDPEPTYVTDIDYRPPEFAWRGGTIVTCLDFADCGYGVIRSSGRLLQLDLGPQS